MPYWTIEDKPSCEHELFFSPKLARCSEAHELLASGAIQLMLKHLQQCAICLGNQEAWDCHPRYKCQSVESIVLICMDTFRRAHPGTTIGFIEGGCPALEDF